MARPWPPPSRPAPPTSTFISTFARQKRAKSGMKRRPPAGSPDSANPPGRMDLTGTVAKIDSSISVQDPTPRSPPRSPLRRSVPCPIDVPGRSGAGGRMMTRRSCRSSAAARTAAAPRRPRAACRRSSRCSHGSEQTATPAAKGAGWRLPAAPTHRPPARLRRRDSGDGRRRLSAPPPSSAPAHQRRVMRAA